MAQEGQPCLNFKAKAALNLQGVLPKTAEAVQQDFEVLL